MKKFIAGAISILMLFGFVLGWTRMSISDPVYQKINITDNGRTTGTSIFMVSGTEITMTGSASYRGTSLDSFTNRTQTGSNIYNNNTGLILVGTSTQLLSGNGKLTIVDTTEPLRLAYDNTNYSDFGIDNAGKLTMNAVGGFTWSFNGTNKMTMASSYMAGATTNNFSMRLGTISDSLPTYAFIGDSDTGIRGLGGNKFSFVVGANEAARFNLSGYLGIGTQTPTNTLSVSGNINVTDGYGIYDGNNNPYLTGGALSPYCSLAGTQTLTNKRVIKRVYVTGSLSTLTPEINDYDIYQLTGLNTGLVISNWISSTMYDGDQLKIRIIDDGTGRALSFGTGYGAKAGILLPTTTIAGKNIVLGFERFSNLNQWILLAYGQES